MLSIMYGANIFRDEGYLFPIIILSSSLTFQKAIVSFDESLRSQNDPDPGVDKAGMLLLRRRHSLNAGACVFQYFFNVNSNERFVLS